MRIRDLFFVGAIVVILGICFGFAVHRELEFDNKIRSHGRQGLFEFIRIIENSSFGFNKIPNKAPICEYKITDIETGAIQFTTSECQLFNDKEPFQADYFPQDVGFKLARVNSFWMRMVIFIPGLLLLFVTILFLYCVNTYRKSRRLIYLKNQY